MAITLTHEQQAWLEARVARGDYSSIENAVRHLVDEGIAMQALAEQDDLTWAKPYVEEAIGDVAAGRVMTLEEHLSQIEAFLAANSR